MDRLPVSLPEVAQGPPGRSPYRDQERHTPIPINRAASNGCAFTSAARRSRKSTCRSPRTGISAINEPTVSWGHTCNRQQWVGLGLLHCTVSASAFEGSGRSRLRGHRRNRPRTAGRRAPAHRQQHAHSGPKQWHSGGWFPKPRTPDGRFHPRVTGRPSLSQPTIPSRTLYTRE